MALIQVCIFNYVHTLHVLCVYSENVLYVMHHVDHYTYHKVLLYCSLTVHYVYKIKCYLYNILSSFGQPWCDRCKLARIIREKISYDGKTKAYGTVRSWCSHSTDSFLENIMEMTCLCCKLITVIRYLVLSVRMIQSNTEYPITVVSHLRHPVECRVGSEDCFDRQTIVLIPLLVIGCSVGTHILYFSYLGFCTKYNFLFMFTGSIQNCHVTKTNNHKRTTEDH